MCNIYNNVKAKQYSEIKEIGVDYFKKNNNDDYILGEGDGLNIIVSRDLPQFNGNYVIDPLGKINLPRLKRIYVQGLTIKELESLLSEKYKDYLINPDIEVYVNSFRPVRILVKGEVKEPGLYVLPGSFKIQSTKIGEAKNEAATSFPSLFSGLKIAGGITEYSDIQSIKVIRKNSISKGGGQKVKELNLIEFLENNDDKQNIRLRDNDYIEVRKSDKPLLDQLLLAGRTNLNPKFINVNIFGKVANPGNIKVKKLTTLNDAIFMAGGTKILKGKIRFARRTSDSKVEKRLFKYNINSKAGSYSNPILDEGDIVFVGRSSFNVANEVLNEVTSPFVGIFATYKVFDIFD